MTPGMSGDAEPVLSHVRSLLLYGQATVCKSELSCTYTNRQQMKLHQLRGSAHPQAGPSTPSFPNTVAPARPSAEEASRWKATTRSSILTQPQRHEGCKELSQCHVQLSIFTRKDSTQANFGLGILSMETTKHPHKGKQARLTTRSNILRNHFLGHALTNFGSDSAESDLIVEDTIENCMMSTASISNVGATATVVECLTFGMSSQNTEIVGVAAKKCRRVRIREWVRVQR